MVKIVTAYSDSSSAHGKALTYLQNLDATGGMKAAAVSEWDKVDQIESMTEREIQDMNTGDTNNSHFGGRGGGWIERRGQCVCVGGALLTMLFLHAPTLFADRAAVGGSWLVLSPERCELLWTQGEGGGRVYEMVK